MNIKKLFPEKKLSRKKILNFLDKKMFYIVLVLCICILGATIFFTMKYDPNQKAKLNSEKIVPEEINNPVSMISGKKAAKAPLDKAAKAVPSNKPAAAGKPDITGKSTGKDETKNNKSRPSKEPAVKKEKAAWNDGGSGNNISLIMPVFGQICVEYAGDKMIYSKTLEEWQTHKYVEIACDKGSPVKASADGFVSEIKDDPKFGVTIVIKHPNGLKTVYSNLASSNMVATNQNISAGDIIGSVGSTAVFESAEQPHLHFEVLKENAQVNPAVYLPKE